MNFVFLIDPIESLNYKKDTSYLIMREVSVRNHNLYYIEKFGISYSQGEVFLKATQIDINEKGYSKNGKVILSSEKIDVLFIRTDPPFDETYLINTWLLDLLPNKVKVINSPQGIREVNEKIWCSKFTELTPRTLITTNKEEYLNFLKKEKTVILKPVNSFGGQSVFLVNENDKNYNVIFETVSKKSKEFVIIQEYVKEALTGDKRILLLNGEPLGAILRVHGEKDHRNNFFAGGRAVKTGITPADLKIIDTIKSYIKDLKLDFVGIDIIGDKLIEVNVTSPTCLVEMNEAYGETLEKKVVDYLEIN